MNRHDRRAAAAEPVRAKGVMHHQIADTCKVLARSYWEESARDNIFYKMFPDPEIFVARNWPRFNEIARSLLVDLLACKYHPGTITLVTDEEKAAIYEALRLDGTVNARKVDEKVNKLITPGELLLPNPTHGAPRNVQ